MHRIDRDTVAGFLWMPHPQVELLIQIYLLCYAAIIIGFFG